MGHRLDKPPDIAYLIFDVPCLINASSFFNHGRGTAPMWHRIPPSTFSTNIKTTPPCSKMTQNLESLETPSALIPDFWGLHRQTVSDLPRTIGTTADHMQARRENSLAPFCGAHQHPSSSGVDRTLSLSYIATNMGTFRNWQPHN